MLDFPIVCNYELNPLLREVIGANLSLISGEQCILSLGEILTCSATGVLRLKGHFGSAESLFSASFISKGKESFAGNLFGFEVVEFVRGNQVDRLSELPLAILSDFGRIIQIVGLGETRNEVVTVAEHDVEDIACFFPANTVLPDTITISKKTLEIMGFLFETGNWLYLYSGGDHHFSMDFNMEITPGELCDLRNKEGMEEKHLQILTIFE